MDQAEQYAFQNLLGRLATMMGSDSGITVYRWELGPVSAMHGHQTKSSVGLCSSKLSLSTNYSLMVHCTAVCVLGVNGVTY